jgi:hypothetical protein
MQWRGDISAGRKICWMAFLCLIAAGSSLAQVPPDNSVPSGIEILKLQWQKELGLPRNFDPSVIPTGSTFSDPAARASGGSGNTADSARSSTSAQGAAANSSCVFPPTPARLRVFYVYSLTVKNVGSKTITGIARDYRFIGPVSHRELGNHSFLSYEQSHAAKGFLLKGELRSPQTRVVSASKPATRNQRS